MENQGIEFIKNINNNSHDNENNQKFTILLNDQKDVESQLEQFKKSCESHDKHQRKRSKRRYYNLALMAKVEQSTSPEELKLLLKNNIRTFLVDMITNKPHEIKDLFAMIKQSTDEFQLENSKNIITIGVALQITGDACRLGRCRNNCSLFLARGETMTLTTNLAYRYSCFKEIAFIINLQHYMQQLQLNDELFIGQEVRCIIIKKLKTSLAVSIQEAGIINSYDYLQLPNQCYKLPLTSLNNLLSEDLDLASKLKVDFIVLPHIRCLPYLKLLHHHAKKNNFLKVIGSLDLEQITNKMLDLSKFMEYLDYLWLTNLFDCNEMLKIFITQKVIPMAKCLKKPLIGSVPLQRCSDFKFYENHEFLWKLDCMFIEKSSWCYKYPLIVKKLLPIRNYRLAAVGNTKVIYEILSNCQSVVNFIIRTISSIECQAIFLYTKCDTAAKALARIEIYCPVFVILSLEQATLEKNEEENNCLMELSKNLNLRRNLKPVLYTKEMNECEYKPLDYGIEYARESGCLETGDFVITLEVGKENGEDHVQLGVGEDVVIMRAFYVPPQKVGEMFRCN